MVWRFPEVFYKFSRDLHGFYTFSTDLHGTLWDGSKLKRDAKGKACRTV
jgi:hypothetical protein